MFGRSEEEKADKERKKDPAQWTEREIIEHTNMIDSATFVAAFMQGSIDIKTTWLSEPYLFLYDPNFGLGPGKGNNISRAVDILAKFRGYRVGCHMVASDARSPHYVCMIKEEKKE